MFNYLKSFFFLNLDSKKNIIDPQEPTNVYELNIKWFNNFTAFDTKLLKVYTEEKDMDILLTLYSKLTVAHRLVDYMYRTKKGMFADNFNRGKFYIDNMKIRKGKIYDTGKIEYETLYETEYDFSIELDINNNWEII